jgi:hypothetical protein
METSAFQSLKLVLIRVFGLSRDALHIHAGLVVFFLFAAVARKKIGSVAPLLAVLAVAVVAELLDIHDDLKLRGVWRWAASLHDIANTTVWPLAITLLARTRLCGRAPSRSVRPEPPDSG